MYLGDDSKAILVPVPSAARDESSVLKDRITKKITLYGMRIGEIPASPQEMREMEAKIQATEAELVEIAKNRVAQNIAIMRSKDAAIEARR